MDLETVTRIEMEQNGFSPLSDNKHFFTNGKQIHRYFFDSNGLRLIDYELPLNVSLEDLVAELGPYDQHGTEYAPNTFFWYGTMNGTKCTIRLDDYAYEELRAIHLYVDEDQDGWGDSY